MQQYGWKDYIYTVDMCTCIYQNQAEGKLSHSTGVAGSIMCIVICSKTEEEFWNYLPGQYVKLNCLLGTSVSTGKTSNAFKVSPMVSKHVSSKQLHCHSEGLQVL